MWWKIKCCGDNWEFIMNEALNWINESFQISNHVGEGCLELCATIRGVVWFGWEGHNVW